MSHQTNDQRLAHSVDTHTNNTQEHARSSLSPVPKHTDEHAHDEQRVHSPDQRKPFKEHPRSPNREEHSSNQQHTDDNRHRSPPASPLSRNLHATHANSHESLEHHHPQSTDRQDSFNLSINLSDSISSNPDSQQRPVIKKEPKLDHHSKETHQRELPHPTCGFRSDKEWLDLSLSEGDSDRSKTPEDLEGLMHDPPGAIDPKILDRIQGSIIGMALGDALGAHVEFRPHAYMVANPVEGLEGGGTWGLAAGQFTDDTSMALCLANSLVARKDFIPYDQLVRYKWWYRKGYMSSTGKCFDIGAATSQSIIEFEKRQKEFSKDHHIPFDQLDYLDDNEYLAEFDTYCSEDGVAGNGALMRLAPVPLFFFRNRFVAVEFSGRSGQITHGDKKANDACRYYGALIVAAMHEYTKEQILAGNFYSAHRHWFGEEPLHEDIRSIAEGSFKKRAGYRGGIQGKGYIVQALEAALWAFWANDGAPPNELTFNTMAREKAKMEDDSDEEYQAQFEKKWREERKTFEDQWEKKSPFERGALLAVNLGDDTDTTAAIYGQLAGAYYGYKKLPEKWVEQIRARKFMETLSKWIAYEGEQWIDKRLLSARK